MKQSICTICFFFCVVTAFANDINKKISQVFDQNIATSLLKEGTLFRTSYREKQLSHLFTPDLPLSRESSRSLEKSDTVLVEALYLHEKTQKTSEMSLEQSVEKAGYVLRNLSSLEGLGYFSTSAGSGSVLYESSYAVMSQKNRTRIPDPLDQPLNGAVIYALQKDRTFGEFLYRYNYKSSLDSVGFRSVNIDPLKLSFIKVVNAEKMHVSLIVHDLGSHLLVYGCIHAKIPELPGIDKKINSFFATRTKALYDWFIYGYEN